MVESPPPKRGKETTFRIDFGFHSFGRKILISVNSHTGWIASAPPPPKELRLPGQSFLRSDHVQIMFVRSGSIASTASCLSRDRRSYKSSLIAEKSRSALTCVAENACLHSRTAVGWDGMTPHASLFVKNSTESRSRGSLIDSDSNSDSWLVATTPGGSDSHSAPLVSTKNAGRFHTETLFRTLTNWFLLRMPDSLCFEKFPVDYLV